MSSCVCGCVGQKSVIREIDQQNPLSACVLFGRKSLAELIVNSQQLVLVLCVYSGCVVTAGFPRFARVIKNQPENIVPG